MATSSRPKPLFHDDDDDGDGDGDGDGEAGRDAGFTSSLRVNQEYARRFAHNKKREALHRLQELKKSGRVVDSSDDDGGGDDEEDESSDDGRLPARTEVRILDTLAKIRKKDPSIYVEDAKFFDDDDDEEDDEGDDDEEDKSSAERLDSKELENQIMQGSDSPMHSGRGESGDGVKGRNGESKKLKEQKKKPMYLKDAIARQLMEDGSDFDENGSRENGKSKKMKDKNDVVTYAEEQQALKDEFLRSVQTGDEGEGGNDSAFLKLRKKASSEDGDNISQSREDIEIAQRLEEYFGGDDKLDENEKFLKEYLLKKSWVDEDEGKIPSYDEIVGDIMEDEEELEKQERFEADYNFRFEEGAGSQVMGHSRIIDDSVRRKDDSRKQKRLKKKERLSEVALERREELKRLKNIKKREILEKLEKIRSVAGAKDSDQKFLESLGGDDLEEEFDPEEYDKKMREAFGDEYYGAEDADENFEGNEMIGKPDFDAEDEFLGLGKDWDEFGVGNKDAGFAAARMKAKETKLISPEHDSDQEDDDQNEREEEDEDEDEDEDIKEMNEKEEEEEYDDEEQGGEDNNDELVFSEERGAGNSASFSKRKKKAKISLREKLAFDKELEEYYNLDYEDMIGDLPTRFKYRQVKPSMYGLTAAEILAADDKDLNQYVSLRKIAPYTTEEWKPKWRFQVSQKLRKKKALKRQSAAEIDPSINRISTVSRKSRKKMALKAQSFVEDSISNDDGSQSIIKTKHSKNVVSVNGDDICDDLRHASQKSIRKKDSKKEKTHNEDRSLNGLRSIDEKRKKKKKERRLEEGSIQNADDPSLANVSLPSPKVDDQQGEKELKSKRRRRKKGLSLSESRLIAYGKINQPSSKKRKQS